MGIISFLIVLSILVFVHELGHFLVARYVGVTVEVFSIGFGKKIFSKSYKGTLWQIAWIPLGGYVKMKGQDDTDPSKQVFAQDSYNNKSPLQRIAILLAGPLANFLLAAVLYFFIALIGNNTLSPTIGKVMENYPASKAGLKTGDVIIQINQTKVKSWEDLSHIIKDSNQPLTFYIKRNNKLLSKTINPTLSNSENMFREKIQKRMIGISPANKIITIQYSFFDALIFAYDKTVQASQMILLGVKKLLEGIIPSSEIGGVITIGQVVSKASQSSFITLLSIMALISVNLGVLNLLPIPALDGGHILFNLYEFITNKKPNTTVLIYLTLIGWFILGSLMILGLYNDINRLLPNW